MRFRSGAIVMLAAVGLVAPAAAHFLVLQPATDVVEGRQQSLPITLRFTHPMLGGPLMELARPRQFGYLAGGKKIDLLSRLEVRKVDGKSTYEALVPLPAPADYVFYAEPEPYWEPAERKMIVHYTKVVVDAYGAEEGWDALVGFPVEIEPLVRPYGLWTGNSFRGIVRHHGKPVPFATVEIEYLSEGGPPRLPNESFATQVVKADGQGVFSYTMPKAGWWGMAALVEGDEKLPNPQGEKVSVELGGVMWVKTIDWH